VTPTLARCFLINLAADIFDDAASPGIKLIEGEDFGCPDIPSKQFEASDLVIVADNLRQISYDKVAAWLDGVDDIACPGTCLVLQVVARSRANSKVVFCIWVTAPATSSDTLQHPGLYVLFCSRSVLLFLISTSTY
jgi:hypothetical protein